MNERDKMPTLKYPKVVTTETEVRRCPFCDSVDLSLRKEIIDTYDRYYVMCDCCKAKGSIAAIPYVAIKKWDGIGIEYGLSRKEQFKPTRGSSKSLLQTAILLHETKEFNKLSVEEIYSILLCGLKEKENIDDRKRINKVNSRQ